MSDLSKELEAAFAIEKHKAETMRREVEARERDEANYPERCRAQRHHDVLCLVLKAGVEAAFAGRVDGKTEAQQLIAVARKHADLAYPPPKAEEP